MNPQPPANQPNQAQKQTADERRATLHKAFFTPNFPRREPRHTPEERETLRLARIERARTKERAKRQAEQKAFWDARGGKPEPKPKKAEPTRRGGPGREPDYSEQPPEDFFRSLLDSPDLQAVIREWQAEGRDVKMKRHRTGWWLQVDKHHAPIEEFQKLVRKDPEVQRERLRRAVHHNITGSDMIGGKSGE